MYSNDILAGVPSFILPHLILITQAQSNRMDIANFTPSALQAHLSICTMRSPEADM